MSSTAKRLLDLFYEWMKEARKCSSNLRGVAKELESAREICNAVKTGSNTVAVTGTVLSILAAPFTGGASLAVGAVAGGLGAGVSAVTTIIETLESSSKLKEVEKIDKKCNEIVEEIRRLYNKLIMESPSSSDNNVKTHVMKELLKAMLIRLRLDDSKSIKAIDACFTVEEMCKSSFDLVTKVLSMFSLTLGEVMGCAYLLTGNQFLGVAAGLLCLPDAINNWKRLIKDDYETAASKSLKETAQTVDKMVKNLSDLLILIEKMLKERLEIYRREALQREASQRWSTSPSSSAVGLFILSFIVALFCLFLMKEDFSEDWIQHPTPAAGNG